MPTLKQITDFFDRTAPKELGAPWDNEGVMVARDMAKPVGRVLLALDAIPQVIERAIAKGYDCVITHHPLTFAPFRTINPENHLARQLRDLILADVAVLSYHTRLDSAEGYGVNATLAELVGLREVETFGNSENPALGRIGSTEGIPLGQLAQRVKEKLGCPAVSYTGRADTVVNRLAIAGGGAKDFVPAAIQHGADTFLIGEINYNPLLDYAAAGLNMVCGGHFHTEAVVLPSLKRVLEEAFPGMECDIYQGDVGFTCM